MIAFGLYIYFFLEAELLFTNLIGEKLGEANGTLFYGIFCFAAALGFFAFSFIDNMFSSKRLFILLSGLVGTVSNILVVFSTGSLLKITSTFVMFVTGLVGGVILYRIASQVKDKEIIGLFIAIPYAIAFLLQFLLKVSLPLLLDNESIVHHIIVIIAFILSFILIPLEKTVNINNKKESSLPDKETKKYIVGAVIAGLLIFCLYGMMDGIIMTLHTGQQLNPNGLVRLLCVPGILFAGWIFDLKEGRYFSFASAIAMVAAVVAIFLFNAEETYDAALGSIYFFCSFMTMYSLAVFIRISESTNNPSFFASAGRGIKYLAGGVFALAGSIIFSNLSLIVLVLIYLVILIMLFLVLFVQGNLTPSVIGVDKTTSDVLDEQIKKYKITKREFEVLQLLMRGQDTDEIASKLYLNKSTVNKYISSMIMKTDVKSRVGLIAVFSNQR